MYRQWKQRLDTDLFFPHTQVNQNKNKNKSHRADGDRPLLAGRRGAGPPSLREQLAGLGAAGLVAYGILNTAYYTAAFYLIWRHVARVPRGAPPPQTNNSLPLA